MRCGWGGPARARSSGTPARRSRRCTHRRSRCCGHCRIHVHTSRLCACSDSTPAQGRPSRKSSSPRVHLEGVCGSPSRTDPVAFRGAPWDCGGRTAARHGRSVRRKDSHAGRVPRGAGLDRGQPGRDGPARRLRDRAGHHGDAGRGPEARRERHRRRREGRRPPARPGEPGHHTCWPGSSRSPPTCG